jgi:hypothetical protein
MAEVKFGEEDVMKEIKASFIDSMCEYCGS